jgi:transglutaminase-like putative cysteine protease
MNARLLPALFCLAVTCALAPSTARAAGDTTTTFDRWYVLTMSGEQAGYAHSTERRKGDRIITQTDMKLTVRRGEQAISVEHQMWFVETADGRPLEASSTLKPGALAIVQHAKFNPDGIDLTTGRGPGARTTTVPPLDGKYLPPAAAQRLIEKRIADGAQEISLGLIEASSGVTALDMSMKLIGKENVEVFGKVVPAVVWEANASNLPGVTMREYVDTQGRTVKSSVQLMPGMDIEMIEADEQLARARVDPPRVMARTFIHPDRPIESPRTTRSAIYRVSVKGEGKTPISLPRTGYQRVVYDDRSTAAVVLDLNQPVNVIDDLPTEADLESSHMIDHQSAAVRRLLNRALPDTDREMSDRQRASRLRAFVHRYIDEKDLSVGLATAGQVAQTAQGDCTEHAVLLTALLRAQGIPARTVTGLLYVDEFLGQRGVFGYHMWSQAWLTTGEDGGNGGTAGGTGGAGGAGGPGGQTGGRWVDLDAVLDGKDFDAAHIALSVSSMRDGQMVNDMVEMLPLFGRLEVKVIQAQ